MKPLFFDSPKALRAWLEAHHRTKVEVWVGFHKRHTGRQSPIWSEVVEQALCFGWIDGVRQSLDAERWAIRLTPRKPRSNWSAINVRKMAELESKGLVAPAGRAAFEGRTASREYAYEQRQAAQLSVAEQRLLESNRRAWAYFAARPPSYQRTATFWVVSPKRPQTRVRRLEQLIAYSAKGQRIPPLRPRPGKG